jgi:predicted RecA/RadA family phage recombinase
MTTAVGERFAVRVMVTPAWETVSIQADGTTTVAQLKREALRAALKTAADEDAYVVKFRGAAILDESIPLRTLGAGANAPFIVLPGRRQPVR